MRLRPLPFLLPLFFLLGCFIVLPVLGTLWTAFHQDITFLGVKWVGFRNYIRLFADASFRQSLRFTLLFILVSVPLELVLGMALAQLLNIPHRFRGVLRACVLIPWAIPAAISARVWELIYNVNYGAANAVLEGLGLRTDPVNWLGTSAGAFWAVVIADVWKTTPFVAIILLAGLAALPDTLHKQAEVDGAGLFRRFFSITLPLMRPVLVVALLFRTIDALRIFDLLYVLTAGGPGGDTTSLSLLGFRYLVGGDFGFGAAVSVVLFGIALLLSLLYVKAGRFGETAV